MKEGSKKTLAALGMVAVGITAGERSVAARPDHDVRQPTQTREIDPDMEVVPDEVIADDAGEKSDYANDPDALIMGGDESEGESTEIKPDEDDLYDSIEGDVEDHPTLDPGLINKGNNTMDKYIEQTLRSLIRWRYGSEAAAEKYLTKDVNPDQRDKIISLVSKYVESENQKLPPHLRIRVSLMLALIGMESNFKTKLVSKAGARGLCQIMPGSARQVGVNVLDKQNNLSINKVNDPEINIQAGVKILARFIKYFSSVELGMVAYNEGDVNLLRNLDEVYGAKNLRMNGENEKRDMQKIRKYIESGKINLRDVLGFYLKKKKINKKTVSPLLYPAKVHRMEEIIKKIWGEYIADSVF